ncbi:MAG: 30S ribosome-binding factor RbfA [Pseudomonadota bacterium]
MARLELFVPAKAASHRQKKVSEEIKHHLALALARGDLPVVRNPSGNGFLSFTTPITVTKVEVSPDLKHVTCYIMPLGGAEQEKALIFVRLQRWYLRKHLGTKIQLRHTPDLHFQLDTSFDEAERIHKMLAAVIQPEAPETEPNEDSELQIKDDSNTAE